jgi:hypothetical protein
MSKYMNTAKLFLATVMMLASSLTVAAYAQYSGTSYTSSLRNPLIQGAPNAQANQAPQQGPVEIPGDGPTPVGVTPGMTGTDNPPPSDVSVPPMSALQHFQVSALVQPYLTPPPSTPGADPGMLPPLLDGIQQDAAIVNVNQGGGLPVGQAPTKRRQGQMTADYGLTKTNGSQLDDFGQLLPNMPNLATTPQYTQDGTRAVMSGGMTGVNRSPNMTGAQETQDLYGFRQQFDGSTRPIMTIAPY